MSKAKLFLTQRTKREYMYPKKAFTFHSKGSLLLYTIL